MATSTCTSWHDGFSKTGSIMPSFGFPTHPWLRGFWVLYNVFWVWIVLCVCLGVPKINLASQVLVAWMFGNRVPGVLSCVLWYSYWLSDFIFQCVTNWRLELYDIFKPISMTFNLGQTRYQHLLGLVLWMSVPGRAAQSLQFLKHIEKLPRIIPSQVRLLFSEPFVAAAESLPARRCLLSPVS